MSKNQLIAVAGTGFSGAVVANELAKNGYYVEVFESRDHVAGNCFSQRDSETGIMTHKYGPHIFHTDKKHVWDYIKRLSEFKPYINRVKANHNNKIYSLPINLHTINQFFGTSLNPTQAFEFIKKKGLQEIEKPANFEEQALKFLGNELYHAFFYSYTIKQWGRDPKELPASILKRLPVRFNYDDNYFNHYWQGMPIEGYTPVIEKLLNHPNIKLYLKRPFNKCEKRDYSHVFYSGPLDSYFHHKHGRLGYRSLRFETIRAKSDYQGCAVLNYCDDSVPYTRISEHKHFAPWEKHKDTICFVEYSYEAGTNDTPYYPIRLVNEAAMLEHYTQIAQQERDITFIGRLGTYRYLDMDTTIDEALRAASTFLKCQKEKSAMPTFLTTNTAN